MVPMADVFIINFIYTLRACFIIKASFIIKARLLTIIYRLTPSFAL